MEGLNLKRMGIALAVAALCGAFCAYGTTMVEIPGFQATIPYLATIFYARLLIGIVVGLAEPVKLMKKEPHNSLVRGAIIGLLVSPTISFYGGTGILMGAGAVYGLITDFLATKFGK